jgi:transcriptional regulator with XRE-family HTH domain
MPCGVQVRMARAALGWSVSDLADHSGVSVSTIKRLENDTLHSSRTVANTRAIQQALESAGIEFVGTPSDAPGVRLRGTPDARSASGQH